MTPKTIVLPDGYNSHTKEFFAKPIATDDNCVKLQVAVSGEEYMFSWFNLNELVWQDRYLISQELNSD